MMTAKLYASDGATLVYTFDYIIDEDGVLNDPVTFSEHTSLRGQGSIISEGTLSPFDLKLSFVLKGTDYYDLMNQMNTVINSIVKFTPYVLKISTTSASTTKNINVKRISAIEFPPNTYKQKRVKLQNGIITFRCLCW